MGIKNTQLRCPIGLFKVVTKSSLPVSELSGQDCRKLSVSELSVENGPFQSWSGHDCRKRSVSEFSGHDCGKRSASELSGWD